VGDNAAQAAARHSETHQSTAYGREELQTAKQDSTFIAVATNSTEKRDQLERQPEGVYTLILRSLHQGALMPSAIAGKQSK
tara:strand:+ start:474 stop:716 length:243 start_codon:yes stop_codon:yes gene_type:complete